MKPTMLLNQIPEGVRVRLREVTNPKHASYLRALGLSPDCELMLAKAGSPWIVRVRSTRIGLSDEVAASIVVVPPSPL